MKNLKTSFFALIAVLLLMGSGTAWGAIADGDYVLCTSTSDLVAGGHYIIASMSSGTVKCISNVSNSNNRKIVETTVSNGKITVGSSSTIMTFTLGGSIGAWTLSTDNYAGTAGYLASAASGSNNYLRVIATSTTGTISFSDNAAVITLQPHSSRNILRFNSQSSCFACYSGGQAAIYLFKKASEKTTVKYDANGKTLSSGSTLPADDTNATAGQEYTVSTATVAADDFTFKGWNTDKNATAGITKVPAASMVAGETVTLYAIWEAATQCTPITPSISYSSASVKEGLTSETPSITGNTGSGAVTYSIKSGSEYAEINSSTGVVTAKTAGAGSVVVEASIAASGGYCQATCSTTVSVVAATITASSNDTELGTVQLNGKVITASPNNDCVEYATPAYTVTGTANVVQNGNDFTVTPTGDCSVQINFAAKLVDHFVDNIHSNEQIDKCGNGYTIPVLNDATKGSGCDGEHYKFIGWSASAIASGTETEPSGLLKTGNHNADGTTYYAVWAKEKEAQQ